MPRLRGLYPRARPRKATRPPRPEQSSPELSGGARWRDHISMIASIGALLVSMASVGVTWIQAAAADKQVALAEAQIEEVRRQFERAGPVLTVTSLLLLTSPDPTLARLIDGREAPVVDQATYDRYASPDTNIFLVVQIANKGREASAITNARMKVSEDDGKPFWLPANYRDSFTYCDSKLGTSIFCADALPHVLDPGRVYLIYFSIQEWYGEILKYGLGEQGLSVEVDAVGVAEEPIEYLSPVRVVR